ncbi:MAG: hypothetical protein J6581_10135, partial [Apibacter sp.]|nr:hypothetical protein [Apibacter sp.]
MVFVFPIDRYSWHARAGVFYSSGVGAEAFDVTQLADYSLGAYVVMFGVFSIRAYYKVRVDVGGEIAGIGSSSGVLGIDVYVFACSAGFYYSFSGGVVYVVAYVTVVMD